LFFGFGFSSTLLTLALNSRALSKLFPAATDRVRLLFRQEKTLKVRANHIVLPGTKLAPHSGSDKACVWSAVDFADGEQKPELFCVRFASPERAAEFKAKFDDAMAHNEAALGADLAPVPLLFSA
jgi:Ran-binding protein 1